MILSRFDFKREREDFFYLRSQQKVQETNYLTFKREPVKSDNKKMWNPKIFNFIEDGS